MKIHKPENMQTYTDELEKLVSFFHKIRLNGRSLKETLELCVLALKSDFGYDSVELYCHYKYTRHVERAAVSDAALPLRDIHSIRSIMSSGEVQKEYSDQGIVTLYLPIPLPDLDGSNMENDMDTHWGVLVAISTSYPSEYSLNILKLAALEITRICEIFELQQYEKNMQNCLTETHLISVNIKPHLDISQLFTLWSNTEIVRRLFDSMAIWIHGNNSSVCYGTENIRALDLRRFLPKVICIEPREFYDIRIDDYYSVILLPLINGNTFIGTIGFFKTYKRMLRSEERAAALVISEQVSYNIQNIFLHKNLEEQNLQLSYEKEFNEKIFVSINSGIIVTSETGKVLMANPYSLNKLGYSLEELTNSTLEEHVPGLLTAVNTMQGEGVFVLSNQKEIHLGFSMSRLQYNDDLSGIIILFRDITEIVNLRNELKRKEYFSTIGKMASWIAHEVRNPIFAIASIARILLNQTRNTEQEKFVSSILKETKSLNNLVEDLLMYGKPMEMKFERVLIPEFIEEIAEGMKSIASEFGGVIKTVSDSNDLLAEIDKEKLKQVLYNLIKNSLEAGATSVSIAMSSDMKMIKISVIDNGKGIKPTDIGEMFIPFFTTKKSGTGLGLSICKKIIEEHGGSIQVSSVSEIGAHIQIALKRA